jgi:hypothetical protein
MVKRDCFQVQRYNRMRSQSATNTFPAAEFIKQTTKKPRLLFQKTRLASSNKFYKTSVTFPPTTNVSVIFNFCAKL